MTSLIVDKRSTGEAEEVVDDPGEEFILSMKKALLNNSAEDF